MSLATNFQNILEVVNRKIGFKLDKSEANQTYASKTDLRKTENKVSGISTTVGKMTGRLLPDPKDYDVEDGYVVTWQKDGWYPKVNPGKKVAISLEQNGSTWQWGPSDGTTTIADITTLLNNGKQIVFSIGDEECNITSWTWGEIIACSFSVSKDSWTNTTECVYYYVKAQRDYSNDQDVWTVIQYTPKMIPNTDSSTGGKMLKSSGGSANGAWELTPTVFPYIIDIYSVSGTPHGTYNWVDIKLAYDSDIPIYFRIEGIDLIVPVTLFVHDDTNNIYKIEGTTFTADTVNKTIKMYNIHGSANTNMSIISTSYESSTLQTDSWYPTTP